MKRMKRSARLFKWRFKASYVPRFLALLLAFLFLLPATEAYAFGEINYIGNGAYAITSYRVEIIVNEDNTFAITEYITAQYNEPRRGIIREIPLSNNVIRLDGSRATNRAQISNISVSGDPYTVYTEGNNRAIRIGDANTYITGSKDYVISYTYDIGADRSKNYDELYFNIIGTSWDTTLSQVEFAITMPKDFEAEKLGFSSGKYGSTSSESISYEVKGNLIIGRYEGVLWPNEALTVRLELPDGYFVRSSGGFDLLRILALVLPVIFAVVTLFLWYFFGKDERVFASIQFYPPEGMNSAELGFLYKGWADTKCVVSLLVYLAEKGYIKISESSKEKSFLAKEDDNFAIIKTKEYDGKNYAERLFLSGLFAAGRVVTIKDLKNKFYITMEEIKKLFNDKENRQQVFEKGALSKSFLVGLLVVATLVLISWAPVTEYWGTGIDNILALVTIFVMTVFWFAVTLLSMRYGKFDGKKYTAWFFLAAGFVLVFIMFNDFILPGLLFDPLYVIAYAVGMVCIVVMVFCMVFMKRRTAYGNDMLGKIQGFKNFLERAEKNSLELLVNDDPHYFYNILPYTYVLGISDKWIKKFETISMQAPDWYSGAGVFSMAAFGAFMNATMDSAGKAMSPSSSGSGGGSSGGGSGGGGGSSW